jgi:hypothetical protein
MAKHLSSLVLGVSGSIGGLAQSFRQTGGFVTALSGQLKAATDSVQAYKAMSASIKPLKLASTDAARSFQTTMAVARSELAKFSRNSDVQYALEVSREKLSESWISARNFLRRSAAAAKIDIAVSAVVRKTSGAPDWLKKLRRDAERAARPITLRVEVAKRGVESMLADVRKRVESLKQYRSVRIAIAAVNAMKLPVQAALATLGPIRRLATSGIVVALRATHFGITKGVDAAKRALRSLSSAGRSVVSGLTSTYALLGSALAAAGIYGVGSYIKSAMDAVDATNDQANALGMDVKALSQFSYAAKLNGSDQETLAGGLTKMNNALSDAVTKGGAAGDAFKTLGLDAGALSKMTPDEAFKKIADGISKVENPAQRTSLAMDIFGKSGAKLIPLLLQGENGLNDFSLKADKAGASISAIDAAKVAEANDALDDLKEVIGGVGKAIAAQLSPFITDASSRLVGMATAGEGVGPKVSASFEWVAKSIASASDYVSLLRSGFKWLQAGVTIAAFGVVTQVDSIGKSLARLINLIPGVNVKFTEFTSQLAAGLLEDAKGLKAEAEKSFAAFQSGASSEAVTKYFADVRAKAQKAAEAAVAAGPKVGGAIRDIEDTAKDAKDAVDKLGDAMTSLENDVKTLGMSDAQKELFKLQQLGADPAQLSNASQWLDLKAQLESVSKIDMESPIDGLIQARTQLQSLFDAGKITGEQFRNVFGDMRKAASEKLADQAKSVIESLKTPLDKYNEQMQSLQDMLAENLLSNEQYTAAVAKISETFKPPELPEMKFAKAIRTGSAEAQAMRFVGNLQLPPSGRSLASLRMPAMPSIPTLSQPMPITQTMTAGMREMSKDLTAQLLAESKKQTGLLTSIDRKTEKDDTVTVSFA